MIFVISAVVSFAYIFLKATQQLNVMSGQYWRVWPTSVLMGVGEATILIYIIKANTLWIGVVNGVAAGGGAMLGMWLHKRTTKSKVAPSRSRPILGIRSERILS